MKNTIIKLKSNTKKIILSRKGNFIIFLSPTNSDLLIEINSSDISLLIIGVFFVSCKNVKKNLVVRHNAAFSKSSINVISLLFENSSFILDEKIVIEKQCQNSEAVIFNRNILFSNAAKAIVTPILEIFNKNNIASHATTTGCFSESKQYYLKTRKLEKKQIFKVLSVAEVAKCIKKLKEFDQDLYLKQLIKVSKIISQKINK